MRIREAKARMYQSEADEAQREAEGYWQMIQANVEKVEEEYSGKFSELCLQEREEKRGKEREETRGTENFGRFTFITT